MDWNAFRPLDGSDEDRDAASSSAPEPPGTPNERYRGSLPRLARLTARPFDYCVQALRNIVDALLHDLLLGGLRRHDISNSVSP